MKTVAVIEGFSGGPIKTRRFRQALTEAGFKVIKDRRQADIIVAHSAGIYGIPLKAKASLLILIGPTYWPGRPLVRRMLKHMRDSKKYYLSKFGRAYYLRKKLVETFYFFTRNKYLWLGIAHNNRLDRLEELISKPNRKTIIIRNEDDAYSGEGLEKEIKGLNVIFLNLPGIHDDYYENPEPYIKILKDQLKAKI